MTGLTANGVSVGYPGRSVLSGVALDVRPGELLALIGPNGAGKSTLLRAMGRQLRPTVGVVEWGGESVWDRSPGWAARRLALAHQSGGADRPVSVTESVALGRAPHRGWLLPLTGADRTAVANAIERVGLAGFESRPVTELSAGEAQRVFLARALAQEPGALLADEPTAHLDLRYQGEVLDLLRRLARGGMTVVAALHDLNQAGLWADRVALLAGGRVVAVGPPPEVLTAERLTAAYQAPVAVARHPEFGTPLVTPVPRGPL